MGGRLNLLEVRRGGIETDVEKQTFKCAFYISFGIWS